MTVGTKKQAFRKLEYVFGDLVQEFVNLKYEKALNPEMSFHFSPMVAFGGGANVGYKYFLADKFIIEGSLDLAFIDVSSWFVSGGGFAPTSRTALVQSEYTATDRNCPEVFVEKRNQNCVAIK